MQEEDARKILKSLCERVNDDELYSLAPSYVKWSSISSYVIELDGVFSKEELEAVVWWVKNNGRKED